MTSSPDEDPDAHPDLLPLYQQETSRALGAEARPLPVAVRTPPEQWAYAVRFDRVKTVGGKPMGPAVVTVAARVEVGTIGVGCLTADRGAFVDEEFIDASSSVETVALVLPNASDAGPLVIRNASGAGPSVATILDVQCSGLPGSDAHTRAPGLSDPRAESRWGRYYGSRGETPLQKYRVRAFEAPNARKHRRSRRVGSSADASMAPGSS
jgi:hypothetical protein